MRQWIPYVCVFTCDATHTHGFYAYNFVFISATIDNGFIPPKSTSWSCGSSEQSKWKYTWDLHAITSAVKLSRAGLVGTSNACDWLIVVVQRIERNFMILFLKIATMNHGPAVRTGASRKTTWKTNAFIYSIERAPFLIRSSFFCSTLFCSLFTASMGIALSVYALKAKWKVESNQSDSLLNTKNIIINCPCQSNRQQINGEIDESVRLLDVSSGVNDFYLVFSRQMSILFV